MLGLLGGWRGMCCASSRAPASRNGFAGPRARPPPRPARAAAPGRAPLSGGAIGGAERDSPAGSPVHTPTATSASALVASTHRLALAGLGRSRKPDPLG